MTYTQGNLADARTRPSGSGTGASADRTSWCRPRTCSGTSNTRRAMRPAPASCSLAAWKDSALGVAWGTGNALISKAGVALAFGDTAQAERLLDEATSVLRETGPWFLNLPLYVRAILAVRRGDADAAIGFVRETVICSRQLHDRFAFVALIPLAAAAALRATMWVARMWGPGTPSPNARERP